MAAKTRTAPTNRVLALGVMAGMAGLAGCGGVAGIVSGPISSATPGSGSTTVPGPTTVPTGPATTAPVTPVPPTATTLAPQTTAAPAGLRLGGDDLGVTRVGAPFRDGVAAVTTALGRPSGDPAPDTACVGAAEETSWPSFRLAGNGGQVSGWLSTSRTLATPAGVTVGTSLAALRNAYGANLRVRPPAPDSATTFLVGGLELGGTLTGSAPADTVNSLFNGTCEAP